MQASPDLRRDFDVVVAERLAAADLTAAALEQDAPESAALAPKGRVPATLAVLLLALVVTGSAIAFSLPNRTPPPDGGDGAHPLPAADRRRRRAVDARRRQRRGHRMGGDQHRCARRRRGVAQPHRHDVQPADHPVRLGREGSGPAGHEGRDRARRTGHDDRLERRDRDERAALERDHAGCDRRSIAHGHRRDRGAPVRPARIDHPHQARRREGVVDLWHRAAPWSTRSKERSSSTPRRTGSTTACGSRCRRWSARQTSRSQNLACAGIGVVERDDLDDDGAVIQHIDILTSGTTQFADDGLPEPPAPAPSPPAPEGELSLGRGRQGHPDRVDLAADVPGAVRAERPAVDPRGVRTRRSRRARGRRPRRGAVAVPPRRLDVRRAGARPGDRMALRRGHRQTPVRARRPRLLPLVGRSRRQHRDPSRRRPGHRRVRE